MQAGEVVGTEQFAGITPADAARWLIALAVVVGLAGAGLQLAAAWTPPAGDLNEPAPPALLLDLAPLPEPEPEPVVEPEPVPEPVEPEVEPLPPEPEPVVEPEPVPPPEPEVEPLPKPPPVEQPPDPVEPDEPLPPEPDPLPEPPPEPEPLPEPEPVPEPEAPTVALPMPATMSTALQQQRQQTSATDFRPPPRQPRPEPAPQQQPTPPVAEPAPRQQAPAPAQPAAASGPSPQQWQQQVLRYLERRKVYPRAAQQAGQEGVVAIAFTIDGSGRILSASVARSSGIAALDQAALDTARRASPVPAPPASLGSRISLTASIRFTLR